MPSWMPLAAAGDALPLSAWSVAPFVLLLLSIAVLPLAAPHWWHRNRNRALVSAGLAAPVVAYLVYLRLATGEDTLSPLLHELEKYVAFVLLLGSLYTVSGGIHIGGDIRGRPLTNTAVLALGSLLANLIGTTGASMLLVRPLLRTNRERLRTKHIPIFFIFLVSNVGGCLTPLGDPPLFLGYLHGVPFAWTLSLWREWLLVNSVLLALFFLWDTLAYVKEPAVARAADRVMVEPVRVEGLANLPLLAGIMISVLAQSRIGGVRGQVTGAALMLLMAVISIRITPRRIRLANRFNWGPMAEVAILFAGIFITMVPALGLLEAHGARLGLEKPWQFFWLTGLLSGVLDNAPTYMTFATVAAGSSEFGLLAADRVPGIDGPLVLRAISCGAVFMGALTYIGNGPNFMVKAIAEESGFRMASFFGYTMYAGLVLIPLYAAVSMIFYVSG